MLSSKMVKSATVNISNPIKRLQNNITTENIDKDKKAFYKRLNFWYSEIGANPIPMNTRSKTPTVKEYKSLQYNRLKRSDFENWIELGKYNGGAAVMLGRVYREFIADKDIPRYLGVIDIEKQLGIDEICTLERNGEIQKITIDDLASKLLVEQHSGNPSSAHIFFYTTEPIPNRRLIVDNVCIMETFGEPKHLMNVSPSTHKDGTDWAPRDGGTLTPDTIDGMVVTLQRIFKKYGQEFISHGTAQKSTKFSRIGKPKLTEGNRHDELRDSINSLISKTIFKFGKETIRQLAYTLNKTECEKPYDDGEIYALFESCWTHITKNIDTLNSPDIPQLQVTPSTKEALAPYYFSITNYEPMSFMVAHRELNQIVSARIDKEKRQCRDENGKVLHDADGNSMWDTVCKLRVKTPIINAIPVSVKKFDDGIHLEYQYNIRFNTKMQNKTFITQTNTIEGIVQELKDKGMILGREPNEALTHILQSMESMGNVSLSKSVQKRGFWLIDNKLDSYDVTIRKLRDEEVRECITLLEELYSKFKVKSVFPTTIKWGIVSPFSFVMKSYGNWLPWIHSHGFTNCGKTFGGILVLAMWRLGEEHNISFESISSVARFGEKISQTTFPVVINEAGSLSEDKYKEIVEMIKNAIEMRIARSKFKGNNRYDNIDALRACIITANPAPPNDTAYKRKLNVITYGVKDRYEKEAIKEFNEWFRPKKYILGTLGDFAADYIMKKAELLKKPWNDIGIDVLSEFYRRVEMEPPKWIHEQAEHSEISDSIDDAYQNLRSYLMDTINIAFSRLSNRHENNNTTPEAIQIINRLDACCEQHLIPSIEKHEDCYVISQTIMQKLREDKCDGYAGGTLKGFAEVLEFEYGQKRIGGKPTWVAHCKFQVMQDLLSGYCPKT